MPETRETRETRLPYEVGKPDQDLQIPAALKKLHANVDVLTKCIFMLKSRVATVSFGLDGEYIDDSYIDESYTVNEDYCTLARQIESAANSVGGAISIITHITDSIQL